MNKVDLLGHAAIEYAAQQVVTERAAAKELQAKLDSATAELASIRNSARWAAEYEAENKAEERHAVSALGRLRDDLKKIRDARFWERRQMIRKLLDQMYWSRY
jgi:hypothetical protein